MNSARYTKTAVLLHWLIALGIFVMFGIGWFMADLPKKAPDQASFDLFDLGIFSWQVDEAISPRAFYFNLHISKGVLFQSAQIYRHHPVCTHRYPYIMAHYAQTACFTSYLQRSRT